MGRCLPSLEYRTDSWSLILFSEWLPFLPGEGSVHSEQMWSLSWKVSADTILPHSDDGEPTTIPPTRLDLQHPVRSAKQSESKQDAVPC